MTVASISPNASVIATALTAFMQSVLPSGTPVVRGQANRVPEPYPGDFVVFTPLRRQRLETNVDGEGDVVFTASFSGGIMNVTTLRKISNPITPQTVLFGPGVAAGTKVITQNNGPQGGIGAYQVSPSQNLTSRTITAGRKTMTENWEVVIQVSVHGPNSEDNATILSTAFRDEYAVQFFNSYSDAVVPLYADDPKLVPFVNDQDQWEDQWIVETHIQANQEVLVTQLYADSVKIPTTNVEATYPA